MIKHSHRYVDTMKPNQQNIYYIVASDRKVMQFGVVLDFVDFESAEYRLVALLNIGARL
jgi:hypothetical protein